MNAMTRQQGFSFTSFIVIASLVIGVAITSMKILPVYLENKKIQKAFDAMVRDPALQNAPDKDIRMAFFNRATTIDAVTAIGTEDFDISHENNTLVLSASYSVKVPLAGNVSLLIEFHPTTAK